MFRFKDDFYKDMTYNQLTIVIVDNISMIKEVEVPAIYTIPDENIYLENVYYHGINFLLNNKKESGFIGRSRRYIWRQIHMKSR